MIEIGLIAQTVQKALASLLANPFAGIAAGIALEAYWAQSSKTLLVRCRLTETALTSCPSTVTRLRRTKAKWF